LLVWALAWAIQHQHANHNNGNKIMTYSLVDKEFLVFSLFTFDSLLHLDLLQLTALFEHLAFCLYPLLDQLLALIDRNQELPGIFKLSSQLLELLSHLSISTSGLASLSYFATSETDICVVVVSIGTSFELET
jgi:hypothetical protein